LSENKLKDEIPDFIVQSMSNTLSQYIMEYGIKDNNTIIRLSAFSEFLIKEIYDCVENFKTIKDCNDIEFLYSIAEERKKLIFKNINLYSEINHLFDLFPDYIIISIIRSVNFISESFSYEQDFESDSFYGRLGENICLDLNSINSLERLNIK
jgi:hypothetical protein